jgi:hypothetical protein
MTFAGGSHVGHILRDVSDRLLEGVLSGFIAVIARSHHPHWPAEPAASDIRHCHLLQRYIFSFYIGFLLYEL